MLGWLDANKRFDLAIKAAPPSLRPAVKVVVVGGGAERGHLEDTARDCGVGNSVVFAGERHDVAAVLSAADLLVASSKQETFGLCVLEALTNGVRVLYTTCPALEGTDIESATPVPSTAADMGAAIASEVAAGHRERKPDQAVAEEFGIAAVTGRIDDLYERLARRMSLRTLAVRVRQRSRLRLPAPKPGMASWADVPRQPGATDETREARVSAPDALAGAIRRGGDDR